MTLLYLLVLLRCGYLEEHACIECAAAAGEQEEAGAWGGFVGRDGEPSMRRDYEECLDRDAAANK